MASRAVGGSETTHEYHQTVLRLAHEFSGTEIAWNVSQHVLDAVWNGSGGNAVVPSDGTCIIAHSCQACGFQLHPGWKGTTLRVKRPTVAATKTLRRRELRKRKQAALAKHQKRPKDNNYHNRHRRNSASTNNNTNNSSSSSSSNTKHSSRLYLLRDDVGIGPLDRNHLVLTCGRCGDKTCLKGLKREPPLRWKKTPPPLPPSASKTSSGSVDNLSGNFERLPSLFQTKKPVPPPQSLRGAPKTTSGARRDPPKTTLLEQKLGKHKKKKKPALKKTGNLMNFLSSLNDH